MSENRERKRFTLIIQLYASTALQLYSFSLYSRSHSSSSSVERTNLRKNSHRQRQDERERSRDKRRTNRTCDDDRYYHRSDSRRHHDYEDNDRRISRPKLPDEHDDRKGRSKLLDADHLADEVEDEVAKLVAKRVKLRADEEVQRYIVSEEFKAMVDTMKRRERERIFAEVQNEIETEKLAMLNAEKEKLKLQRQMELDAEQILLQNKLKIEEQRRRDYELKIKQDAERLEEIRRKQQLEVSQPFLYALLRHFYYYSVSSLSRKGKWRGKRKSSRRSQAAGDSRSNQKGMYPPPRTVSHLLASEFPASEAKI